MTTTDGHRMAGKSEMNLAPAAVRGLRKMGYGRVLRDLKRAIRGEATPESRAVVRLCRELDAKFDSANPRLDRKLVGSVVVRLVDAVEYSKGLSERLRSMRRVSGRFRRSELRSLLGLIYEVELSGLRRQIEGLRREIPRLIEELGGDPSQELILPRRRATRVKAK